MNGSLTMSKLARQKACGVFDRVRLGNKASVEILRLYASVAQNMLSTDPAVPEAKECAVAKPAEDE